MDQVSTTLRLLKTHSALSIADIASGLGVSRQAVRQQLTKLAADHLVECVVERAGVGRPRQFWSLTRKGHDVFPDAHAQLTVELIAAIRDEFGTAGLDKLIARRESSTAEGYRRALAGATTLADRLDRLAKARSAEGYMAETRAEADGSHLLIENHCPVCAAAEACQGFCRSELVLFRKLLAPASVQRIEHILAGGSRCAYKVTTEAPEKA